MNKVTEFFQKPLAILNSLIDAIILPDRIHSADTVAQEFDNKRHRTFVIIHLFLVLCSIIDIFVSTDRIVSNLYRLLLLTLHFVMLHLGCRYSKLIFSVYYSFICVGYGVGLID